MPKWNPLNVFAVTFPVNVVSFAVAVWFCVLDSNASNRVFRSVSIFALMAFVGSVLEESDVIPVKVELSLKFIDDTLFMELSEGFIDMGGLSWIKDDLKVIESLTWSNATVRMLSLNCLALFAIAE